jgi:hypothetical protein
MVTLWRGLRVLRTLVLGGIALSLFAQEEIPASERIRQWNAEVLQVNTRIRTGSRADAESLRQGATGMLKNRFQTLRQLVRENPQEALEVALPSELLVELRESFGDQAQLLERRGTFTGELRVVVLDGERMESHQHEYELIHGEGIWAVNFPAGEAPAASELLTEVTGVAVGSDLAAMRPVPLAQVKEIAPAEKVREESISACGPTGPQRVVTILVNLPSHRLPAAVTQELIRGIMSGNAASTARSTPDWSVDEFWRQNSQGRLSVDTANSLVVGPFDLADNYASCDFRAMGTAAMNAARSQVDFRNFHRVQIVFANNNGACNFGGVAYVGCVTNATPNGNVVQGVSWNRGDQMSSRRAGTMLFTHELGHTLGLSHGNSRRFGNAPLGPAGEQGTITAYGHPFNTMGAWNLGFYDATMTSRVLGWHATGAPNSSAPVWQVETAGTFTIQNFEAQTAGPRALRIRRAAGLNAWIWVEARRNTGNYSSRLDAAAWNGILVHYEDSFTSNASHLLDFTASATPGQFVDAALTPDTSWTDPHTGTVLRLVSQTDSAATIQVTYAAPSSNCVRAAPQLTVAPPTVSLTGGAATNVVLTIRNQDSGGCSASTFNIAAVIPPAFVGSRLRDTSLSIPPGAIATTQVPVLAPTSQQGTFPIRFTVTNASATTQTATATSNITVTAPLLTLTVNVTNGRVNLTPGNRACTATNCRVQTEPGANTRMTLTAVPPTGRRFLGWSGDCTGTSLTCTVVMDRARTVDARFTSALAPQGGPTEDR